MLRALSLADAKSRYVFNAAAIFFKRCAEFGPGFGASIPITPNHQ